MSNKFFQMPVPGTPWTGPSPAELQAAWDNEDAPYVGSNSKGNYLVPPKGQKGSLVNLMTFDDEALAALIAKSKAAQTKVTAKIAELQSELANHNQTLSKLNGEKGRRAAVKQREAEEAKKRAKHEAALKEKAIRQRVEAQVRAEMLAAESQERQDASEGRRFKDL